MSAQYIFTTYKLSRRYPPDQEVLSDISLSFLPGAKIGVLGYNGAGKSTLLRIMAGLDTEFDGQAQLAPGATRRDARAGAAARPSQGRARQRRGGRGRGQGAARPLQRALDELLRGDRRRVRARAGADRRGRWLEPRDHARDRDGRAALPAARRRRDDAVGRGAPARGAVPAAAAPARPAAARRADQPPRRRVGGVARAPSARLPRARSSRSPTTATSSTTSPAGSSSSTADAGSPTRATTRAGSSRSARGSSRRRGRRARGSGRSSRSSSGCG